MNLVGMIPDIPKVYTALTEWISCVLYISLYKKRLKNKNIGIVLTVSLVMLIAVQIMIGIMPTMYWMLGMVVAIGIMFSCILACCDFSKLKAGYCCVRAFILAEFTASLEWQLYYYFLIKFNLNNFWIQIIFLIIVFGMTYGIVYYLESRRETKEIYNSFFSVTMQEFWSLITIGSVAFVMSNLSYVYASTPFSSKNATEVFNIRTLFDFGGFAFLYAYHVQREELHMKAELDSIQNVLHTQYEQYIQSRENMDTINRQYHDLKHQITVLRAESNQDKRDAYFDEMEEGIKVFEAQYKTGNSVLDTVLTGKSLICAKHDISLTCVADGTLLNAIYVMDICTIFGNALDNAIECEILIPEKEKRLIHITVSSKNNFILIRVENYFDGTLYLQNDLPVTTKGDKKYHGYGIKSIQYSVQKYGGTISISTQKNWFELKILIPQ